MSCDRWNKAYGDPKKMTTAKMTSAITCDLMSDYVVQQFTYDVAYILWDISRNSLLFVQVRLKSHYAALSVCIILWIVLPLVFVSLSKSEFNYCVSTVCWTCSYFAQNSYWEVSIWHSAPFERSGVDSYAKDDNSCFNSLYFLFILVTCVSQLKR